MSSKVSEILQRFPNLQGITIGERKKEIFLLLKENEGLTPVETDYLIEHLKPATYLERKLFVDILIHFKRQQELIKLFLQGDEALIKPLWKQKWFFEKLLEDVSIEKMVDEIFPNLSFVSRIKFLKNIKYYTKDEGKIDKFHDVVSNKYGPTNAKYVLAGCSLEKISDTISSGHFQGFTNEQLIFLHKNKTGYLRKLLKERKENGIFDFYDRHSKAFKVIAGSDHDFLMEIFRNKDCSTIGKRLTRKIVKQETLYVMKEASVINQRLHQRTLLKSLKSNFEDFFFATWPSSFEDFRLHYCLASMKFCRKGKYAEIIKEGLKKVYNTSFSEHPELIDDRLLEDTDDIQLRESLLELKMEESKDDYTLPKYYRIDKSVPILKKKISGTDGVKTRENLVVALVKTCEINNDPEALLKVQEYFNFRHRNDDPTIRASFLSEIKNCFDLSVLTEDHWKHIFDLMKWSKVKNESFWGEGEIYMMHVKFLFRNNDKMESIRKLLFDNYLKSVLKSFKSCLKVLNDVPFLQKYILQKFMEISPLSGLKNDEKTDIYFELFESIISWNEKHPEEVIDFLLCPDIKESIKIKLKERFHSFSKSAAYFKNFITGKMPYGDGELSREIELIFWENLSDKFDANILEFYLRKKPNSVVENFEKFVVSMKEGYGYDCLTIWRLVKHYSHLGLVERVVEYSNSASPDYFHGNLAIGIATLLEPEEYGRNMSTVKSSILEDDGEDGISNSMKLSEYAKYNNSFSLLPHVVDFCLGDTLHDALPPLYYYFQHCPEKYLSTHLETLSDRAVSVRKHAVKLACAVSPVDTTYDLIRRMTESEKNQSVLQHTYWKTFKYFVVDKSEKFWRLIQLQLKSLNILESNGFKDSCDVKKVPKEFRLRFLTFVWELLDEEEKKGQNVSDLKEAMIRSLTPDIFQELPYEFCSSFIKQEFLRFGNKSNKTVTMFTLNCLKYGTQKQLFLGDIFDIIREFKRNFILNPDSKIARKSRPYVDGFVSDIFYDNSKFESTTIEAFFANWEKVFTPVEDIKNYIRLKLLVELKKVSNLDNFISKVAELYRQFLNEFGILGMVDCFKDALCCLLPNDIFGSDDYNEKIYKLALELTKIEGNDLKLLAIRLSSQGNAESSYCREIQNKLIEVLKTSDDKAVLINLNLYINSLEN